MRRRGLIGILILVPGEAFQRGETQGGGIGIFFDGGVGVILAGGVGVLLQVRVGVGDVLFEV
jgi:hypothetical protein